MAHIGFHKNARSGEWEAIGPAEAMVAGEVVTMTRRDGSTARKRLVRVSRPFDRDGAQYAFATFADVGEEAPAKVEAAPAPKAKAPAKRARRAAAFVPCGYPGCNPGYCDECDGEGMYPSRSRRAPGGDAAPF
jgi:hypothetical protein